MRFTSPRLVLFLGLALGAVACGAESTIPPAESASSPLRDAPPAAVAMREMPPAPASPHSGLLYPYNLPQYHDLSAELAGPDGASQAAIAR